MKLNKADIKDFLLLFVIFLQIYFIQMATSEHFNIIRSTILLLTPSILLFMTSKFIPKMFHYDNYDKKKYTSFALLSFTTALSLIYIELQWMNFNNIENAGLKFNAASTIIFTFIGFTTVELYGYFEEKYSKVLKITID